MHFLWDTTAISYRVDFCVGYFNRKGWICVSDQIYVCSRGRGGILHMLPFWTKNATFGGFVTKM